MLLPIVAAPARLETPENVPPRNRCKDKNIKCKNPRRTQYERLRTKCNACRDCNPRQDCVFPPRTNDPSEDIDVVLNARVKCQKCKLRGMPCQFRFHGGAFNKACARCLDKHYRCHKGIHPDPPAAPSLSLPQVSGYPPRAEQQSGRVASISSDTSQSTTYSGYTAPMSPRMGYNVPSSQASFSSLTSAINPYGRQSSFATDRLNPSSIAAYDPFADDEVRRCSWSSGFVVGVGRAGAEFPLDRVDPEWELGLVMAEAFVHVENVVAQFRKGKPE